MKNTFMSHQKHKVLVVDDEELNLELLSIYLKNSGYQVFSATDGDLAIAILNDHPDIDVIILDRMMPRMDGIQVLHILKKNERLADIPVIMQTAAATSTEIEEGINAGAYYYLPKPYNAAHLLSVVSNALRDYKEYKKIKDEVGNQWRAIGLLEKASFRFRTIEEASNLCYLVANCFKNPKNIVCGLHEIMVNAIEHGNLGITYEEKKHLIVKNEWQSEIRSRLDAPEYRDRFATLEFEMTEREYVITITDQGEGFKWDDYINFSPERATDPNGRGIALALRMSFSSLEYEGVGNKVVCKILRAAPPLPYVLESPELNYTHLQPSILEFCQSEVNHATV